MMSGGRRRSRGWEWVKSSRDTFPVNSVLGGVEAGQKIYVGRAHHEGSLTPGKFSVHLRSVAIPSDTTEHTTHRYEMLVADAEGVAWVDFDCRSGQLPWNAIPGGFSRLFHEPVFIGRCLHLDNVLVGPVHPRKHTCLVTFSGHVLVFHNNFQVLVHTSAHRQSSKQTCN